MVQQVIRFVSNGATHFGQPLDQYLRLAYRISGDIFDDPKLTNELLPVDELLSPLSMKQVGTIRMIGMNYKKHCEEIQLPLPQWPCLFYKPSTALSGPYKEVQVPLQAQIEGAQVDYEAELVVVIGKQGKNISEEDALDHVFGYSVGNDVSQRTWQMARGGSQFSVGKMFDSWAPIGPMIVTTDVIKDPNSLDIGSRVNGEVRQQSNTVDAVFSVRRLIQHLSMGTTLMPGDLIFTGTPQGVGSGFKPAKWLKHGDVVECHIDGIGSLTNTVVFERSEKL